MKETIKFGSQMSRETLEALKLHAKETGKNFSTVLEEASVLYMRTHRVRPEFKKAMSLSLEKYDELYKRLAK